MKVDGKYFRTIWRKTDDPDVVQIIDQRSLPHSFSTEDIRTPEQMATAITDMHLRGAPLIGVAAAYGLFLACLRIDRDEKPRAYLDESAELLRSTRPTAVNLSFAIDRTLKLLGDSARGSLAKVAASAAEALADEEVESCRRIGGAGLPILEEISRKKGGDTINILTHCNAGWLACIDYGTATAPIYLAMQRGIRVHVWVDETRPRNQGANLTAWELLQNDVPHTLIVDNAGGHLMQHGLVDCVITGADRVTRSGDAANKIGTYLKALAAKDNGIPFYIAAPASSFDLQVSDGVREIEIEERSGDEVKYMQGLSAKEIRTILLSPKDTPASNYGFDVTPSRLITALITDMGVCPAREDSISSLFQESGHGRT